MFASAPVSIHKQHRGIQGNYALRSQILSLDNAFSEPEMTLRRPTGQARTVVRRPVAQQHVWPKCPPRYPEHKISFPLATQQPRYVPRISCIAVGDSSIRVDSTDEAEPDDDSPKLEHWPFPAESVAASPIADKPASVAVFDRETKVEACKTIAEVSTGRRPYRHVKQSASCGSPFIFNASFQTPRAAPEVPVDQARIRKGSVASSLQSEHEPSRLRARTVNEQPTTLMRSLVGSIKRAYSLNDAKRGRQQPSLAMLEKQQVVPRARASIRASLNKALPPVQLPSLESVNLDNKGAHDPDDQERPQLPVLEIDSFLHDLTLANGPFLEPQIRGSMSVRQSMHEGQEIII